MNVHIKFILAGLLLSAILSLSTPALAIRFDVWKTGMTLAEIVETARENDIPLTQAGTISHSSGFNQRYINKGFWNAAAVGYLTKLFGIDSTVNMKIAPEQPRRLYEIEIMMTGRMDKKRLYPELINMLIDKYGQPDKAPRNQKRTYRWTLDGTGQITLKLFSAPILTYTDITFKKAVEAQRRYEYQSRKNRVIESDADKF